MSLTLASRARTALIATAPYLIAGGASLLLLVPLLHLWDADLRVPFYGGGDASWMLVHFRSVIEHGWWVHNPDVGAPFGLDLHDFPIGGNNAFFLGIKVLGLFSDDFIAVENVFYLLTYPAVAVAALWCLRRVGVSTAVSVAMAVVFALSPYHVFRAQGHMFLGAAVSVPFACWIAVALASRGRVAPPSRLAVVLVGILLGTASEYYAVFGLLVIGVAAIVGAVAGRSRQPLVVAATLTAIVAVTMVINLAPGLAYRVRHGTNPENVSGRLPQEAEVYAMKPAALLLPVPGHRVHALATLRARYDRDYPLNTEPQAIGLVASVGLVGLLGVVVAGVAGLRSTALEQYRPLALGALVGLGVGTVGGGATLISLGGFTSVRAWNRMSIVVAFFATAAVGLALDRVASALRRRRVPRPALAIALAAVVAVAAVDQVSPAAIPAYAAGRAHWDGLHAYADAVEKRVGAGAIVDQLPYVPFPETPPVFDMVDYDHFLPYVASRDLRWTYGAMRGRAADWRASLRSAEVDILVPSLASAGVAGISVDRFGFADRGAAVEADLARWLGGPSVVSRDGRLAFYDLGEVRRRTRTLSGATRREARRATLYPVRAVWHRFHGFELAGGDTWRWSKGDASIELVNPGPTPRTIELGMAIEGYTDGSPRTVRVRGPGFDRRLSLGRDELVPLAFRITLAVGSSRVRLSSDLPAGLGSDRRPRAIRVINLRLTPLVVERVAAAVAPEAASPAARPAS